MDQTSRRQGSAGPLNKTRPVKVVGVIPARYGSTRFEGKPLKKILDKPLLQWVIEGSRQCAQLSDLFVATDDRRIAELSEKCGVRAVMTDSDLATGSDRVWAAVHDQDCDYVINIQGDEPLLTGGVLDALISAFDDAPDMATLARHFKTAEELLNPNTAKIVINQKGEAIYFSRHAIPHTRLAAPPFICVKHIGLYGYKKEFLQAFCQQAPVEIEKAEGLEQLRALWMGARVKVRMTEYESWGVDTPEDVLRIEQILQLKGARA